MCGCLAESRFVLIAPPRLRGKVGQALEGLLIEKVRRVGSCAGDLEGERWYSRLKAGESWEFDLDFVAGAKSAVDSEDVSVVRCLMGSWQDVVQCSHDFLQRLRQS